jgi:CheY-like chemotaxis protein
MVSPQEPDPLPPDAPPTVLVVDDEASIRAVVAEVLAEEGFVVKQAPDGLAAMAEVERDGIDLIVSDVRMPRLDGPALVRRLRRRGNRIPIVLMSALFDDIDLPGVRFLPKPFTLEHLLDAIAAALRPARRK